jgi:hypothetical protein
MDGFHVSRANVAPRAHDLELYKWWMNTTAAAALERIPPVGRYSQKVRSGAVTDDPAARLAARGYARVVKWKKWIRGV